MVSTVQVPTSRLVRKLGALPLAAALLALALSAPRAYAQRATITIDENCNGSVTWLSGDLQGNTYPVPCSQVVDLTQSQPFPRVVEYSLPFGVAFGDVEVFEEYPYSLIGIIGDVIRFTDGCGYTGGLGYDDEYPDCFHSMAYDLIFYSLAPGTDLADTGFPFNNRFSQYTLEFGPLDPLNPEGFRFQNGDLFIEGTSGTPTSGPCDENCSVTPEPTTMSLSALGGAILLLAKWRQRQNRRGPLPRPRPA